MAMCTNITNCVIILMVSIMKKLEEKTKKESIVYNGSFLEFRKDEVILPDDNIAYREYLHHPGAVAILVIDSDNNIYIERQYRYPLRKVIYEIPAGKLEKDEDILEAAKRELEEETGLVSKSLEKLGETYPCVGYSDEVIYIFLAKDFKEGKQHLDEEEFVDVVKMPFEKVKEMIISGEIKDSKTVHAIYLYEMKYCK